MSAYLHRTIRLLGAPPAPTVDSTIALTSAMAAAWAASSHSRHNAIGSGRAGAPGGGGGEPLSPQRDRLGRDVPLTQPRVGVLAAHGGEVRLGDPGGVGGTIHHPDCLRRAPAGDNEATAPSIPRTPGSDPATA